MAKKFGIPIIDNILRDSIQFKHFDNKLGCNMGFLITLMEWNKMSSFIKSSTTINMLSHPLLFLGMPNTKSIECPFMNH